MGEENDEGNEDEDDDEGDDDDDEEDDDEGDERDEDESSPLRSPKYKPSTRPITPNTATIMIIHVFVEIPFCFVLDESDSFVSIDRFNNYQKKKNKIFMTSLCVCEKFMQIFLLFFYISMRNIPFHGR